MKQLDSKPLAWVVELTPCEWHGREFHAQNWAVTSGSGQLLPYVAVETTQGQLKGLPGFRLEHFYSDAQILGLPAAQTQEEIDAYDKALAADPALDAEKYFSYRVATNEQKISYARRLKADPVSFTDREKELLRGILAAGRLTTRGALNVLAAWRWDTSSNIMYTLCIPELREFELPWPEEGWLGEVLLAKGWMVLSCGEVPVMAIDRLPGIGRLRVVTLEASDCTCEAAGLDIFQYSVFDLDEEHFRRYGDEVCEGQGSLFPSCDRETVQGPNIAV